MNKWLATTLLMWSVVAESATVSIVWTPATTWPTGTTVEACLNDECVSGIKDNRQQFSVNEGTLLAGRARAIPAEGSSNTPSAWAYTEQKTLPALQAGLRAVTQEGSVVVDIVDEPEFGGVGTCITVGNTSVSSISSTITEVAAGDLIIALLQRDDMNSVTGVAFSGHAMTRLAQVNSGSGEFYFEVWGAISPSEYASADIVASFSTSASWGSMVSARWGNVASATPVQSATTGGLSSSSINRFAGSITTTERMLVIGAGTDWDNYNSHTAVNGYTLHFANNVGRIGCTQSVQWIYSQALDAGTYGGDATGTRFGTAESDRMLSAILAFPLNAGY